MLPMFKNTLIFVFLSQFTASQELFNLDFHSRISFEKNSSSSLSSYDSIPYNIKISTHFFLNNSHRNLENLNGKFALKGLTNYTSTLFYYKNKNIFFSLEPQKISYYGGVSELPKKNEPFNNNLTINDLSSTSFANIGLSIQKYGVKAGYGNWNNWSGPGIHNSLTMSNNADGIFALFISTSEPISLYKNLDLYYKYSVSDNLINNDGTDYFISFSELKLRIKNTEIGLNKMVLSGGSEDIEWKYVDAIKTLYKSTNMKYWDIINEFYISVEFKEPRMIAFLSNGGLNQPSVFEINEIYKNHTQANILGIRKYGIGKFRDFLWGFEYTRTIQGPHYDILPTPNWYSNKKYNYSRINNKFFGAHSGPDADDILFYLGYMNEGISVIFAYDYERHGVTYHFPPEVKLEQRFLITKKINKYSIKLYYEKEIYENYAFLNSNANVWSGLNEPGSIQRTKTLTFSIDKKIF